MAAAPAAVLQALRKAMPVVARQLPKLWPLLLESKNREKVTALATDLGARSPRKRLAAKMEITQALAQSVADDATTDEERDRAAQWQQRASKMRVRHAGRGRPGAASAPARPPRGPDAAARGDDRRAAGGRTLRRASSSIS